MEAPLRISNTTAVRTAAPVAPVPGRVQARDGSQRGFQERLRQQGEGEAQDKQQESSADECTVQPAVDVVELSQYVALQVGTPTPRVESAACANEFLDTPSEVARIDLEA